LVTALIGSTGLIGSSLCKQIHVDATFNSSNIVEAQHQQFNTVYCCAPSGNRILANQRPEEDLDNILSLIATLKTIKIQRFVLISTVDTQHNPESPYGHNRLMLEKFAATINNHHIVRLCSLIDSNITKNILYDLKHQCFLDLIDLDLIMHWYKLSDLAGHLATIINNNIREVNLVSEPVSNQEIVDTFFAKLALSKYANGRPYNLTCSAVNLTGQVRDYVYTKDQIFDFIADYLND